jgi:hypothetical protein
MNTDAIHKLTARIRADRLGIENMRKTLPDITRYDFYFHILKAMIGLELLWLGVMYVSHNT